MAQDGQNIVSIAAPAPPAAARVTAQQIVFEIDALVASGELGPGQRLIEADLVKRFGTSRSIVREALRILSGEGVVEILANHGARIRQLDLKRQSDMLDVFSALFLAAMDLLTAAPIAPDMRKQMNRALSLIRFSAKTGDVQTMLDRELDYLQLIAANCNNDFIPELLRKAHIRHFIRQPALLGHLYDPAESCAAYVTVHESLLRQDAQTAHAALRGEIGKLQHYLKAMLAREASVAPLANRRKF